MALRLAASYVVFLAALAAGLAAQAEEVDYERDVKPLLRAKCSACHGAIKQESGLRLDAAKLIEKGGDGGNVIKPGDAEASELIARVSSDDDSLRMPPADEGEPLSAEEVDLLRRWIDAGATAPVDEPIPPNPRDHWAYRPPVRPAVPQVNSAAWQANPIDAFLAARHEEQELTPVSPAPRHVLLRRVYLDLIGLPPTRDELAAFLADESSDAYEKVVDDLLARPAYGERWGRHWMDVWRYSDWSGYKDQIRNSQRHVWRWRDWIIESLNQDKPYDRMVVEMLAGDEIAPADPGTLRATGFLARNWYKFNRHAWLDQVVEHTGKAFLGMTINCCRCHDHKYDPLPQETYYQLRAVFEPHEIRTDPVPGEPDLNKDGLPRAYDKDLQAVTYLFERGNEKKPLKDRAIKAAVPAMPGVDFDVEPVKLPVEAFYPAIRQAQVEARLDAARKKIEVAEAQLKKRRSEKAAEASLTEANLQLAIAKASLASLQGRVAAERAKYFGPAEADANLAPAAARSERELDLNEAALDAHKSEQALAAARKQLKSKPDDKKSKDAVAKAEKGLAEAKKKLAAAEKALAKPGEKYSPLGPQYSRTSSGRRLALARWIVDPENPLTARVAVNHIWLRHFGTPLVANVFDFGLRSPRPRHAELLDWLAVELKNPSLPLYGKGNDGWKMKHIHRLIVTSQAYRLSSSLKDAPQNSLSADPDNHFYWRMNSRRLEAEAVRDSLLAVAFNLDRTRGGPDIDHERGQTSRRRSVYLRHAYEKKMKFLELFDAANETDCYRRTESIIPQQALALANSRMALEQSRLLAGKLLADAQAATAGEEPGDVNDEFIRLAHLTVLSRPAGDDELALCRGFLAEQSQRLADAGALTAITGGPKVSVAPSNDPLQRARENLVHVLMNHNDFVTIR